MQEPCLPEPCMLLMLNKYSALYMSHSHAVLHRAIKTILHTQNASRQYLCPLPSRYLDKLYITEDVDGIIRGVDVVAAAAVELGTAASIVIAFSNG